MDEAAQDAIVRQLEPFVHAAQDMKDVAGAAAFLRGSINDSVRSVLETGLVVSYARPFTRATLSLTGDWLSVADDDLELHEGLIQLRNKVYAHTDRTAWREAVNIGQLVGLEDNIYRQQRALLPEDWPARIADLAERQRQRFEAEVQRLQAQLPPGMPLSYPLFCRVSTLEAEVILANGFVDNTTVTLGDGSQLTGVRFRDEPAAPNDDPDGGVLLYLGIPGRRLRAYELISASGSVDEWVVPATVVNEYGRPEVVPEAS